MSRSRSTARDLALIAVFAALIAAFSLTPAIPVGAVPITLQTLAVSLTGLVLGPWRGFLSVLLYLLVGLAGLPIFTQGGAGLGVFASPSIGYLLTFPFMALVSGLFAWLWLRRRNWLPGKLITAAVIGSLLINHPAGIAGIVMNAKISWTAALVTDLTFVPGDLIKCVLAGFVAAVVHRAFPSLAGQPLPGRRVAVEAPEA